MTVVSHPLLDRFLRWPVVLDSNLLLLHWCSTFDPMLLRNYKRLSQFEPNDILTLNDALGLMGQLATTPHVLTEVSNLANSLPSWQKRAWGAHFANAIKVISENYQPASELLKDEVVNEFGITDAALANLAADHVILTTDGRLVAFLQARKLAAVDFNHLRHAIWLL